MKKANKIFSVILALALVFAMSIPAFAVDITISGGTTGAEYAAYKLLNATNAGEKYAYTLNAKYTDILKAKTGKETEVDIVAYIADLEDDAAIRSFADEVYAAIKTANIEADKTTSTDKFEGVDQGYYLIAETKVGSVADSYSLVMLDTAGQDNITVKTKEDIPSVVKKVQDKNDSTGTTSAWQDAADYDIGDTVPFQLTGTVSAKIADYDTYLYTFTDTMSAGFTYVAGSATVTIDGTVVTDSFTITPTVSSNGTADITSDDTTTLVITCANIKAIEGLTFDGDETIVVNYNATLDSDAVIGAAGNPNIVTITYSNNPYGEGTGTSEEDKVTVFTYKLTVNKTNGKDPLEGAGFTLYKKDSATNTYVEVGHEITGGTTFTWTGLDAGDYRIKETTVPAGYNKADDIDFTITAVYETESADPQLTSLESSNEDVTATLTNGILETTVVNNSGTELPETGGIGTTIIYIVGAILVVGAVVLLISKKRMSAEA